MNFQRLSRFSPALLRVGLAFVLLWFGFSQLKSPTGWTRSLPDFIFGLEPITAIYLNGSLEVILAIFLLLGLFTRVISFLVGIHLVSIAFVVGYGGVWARDLALAAAAFAVFLRGADDYCLDRHLFRKKMNA